MKQEQEDGGPGVASIVEELEQLSSRRGAKLPSSQLLYRIGGVLSRLSPSIAKHNTPLEMQFCESYRVLMETLPSSYLERFFETYAIALSQLVSKAKDDQASDNALEESVQSLYGILSNSPKASQSACSDKIISTLSKIYDHYILKQTPEEKAISRPRANVLGCISFILIDGTQSNREDEEEHAVEESVMELLRSMEEESTDCLGDLLEWQLQSEPRGRTLDRFLLKEHGSGNDTPQLGYVLNMLETARSSRTETAVQRIAQEEELKASKSQQSTPVQKVSAADEMERRIAQVKQILPDLGEGFVEMALSLFQGDVETTVATLLNDPSQYPASLRVIDPKLPRRAKERSSEEVVEARKARELVKERVKADEQAEEARYQALLYVSNQARNEYDDDYDDQYDDIDGHLGGADSGYSDMDFEAIKTYNQVARQEEAENAFWEQNRNTNRPARKKTTEENDGENDNEEDDTTGTGAKKKFGPDKIKGGRIIGADGKVVRPQRRGKKKGGGNSNSSNIQGKNQPAGSTGENKGSGGPSTGAGGGNRGKPRTKPKSGNRVGRQRDRKAQKQGNFGAS